MPVASRVWLGRRLHFNHCFSYLVQEYYVCWKSSLVGKTVDYSFVLKLHQATEKLDAIINNDLSFMLVEFKRNEKQISTEKRRFDCYDDAQDELASGSGHHIIVYGKEDLTKENIELWQVNYFDSVENGNSKLFNPSTVFSAAVEFPKFHAYVKELVDYKKKDGRSGSGGHALEIFECKNVCGISKNYECVVTVPLIDFCLDMTPDELLD